MAKNEEIVQFHLDVAKWYGEFKRLVAVATHLGTAAPMPPEPETASRPTATARTRGAVRRVARGASKAKKQVAARKPVATTTTTLFDTGGNGNGGGNGHGHTTRVAVADLTRPELCFAILRREGRPVPSPEIAALAAKLGHSFAHVAGGASNAVHGAMWRERQKGRVQNSAAGWVLSDASFAPILTADGKWAEVPDTSGSAGRRLADARRMFLVKQFRSGRNNPQGLLDAMRRNESYKGMNRSQLRDDINALIADGKVEKAGYGEYRVTASS